MFDARVRAELELAAGQAGIADAGLGRLTTLGCGGPAALLAERNIKKVETLDYPELGMEAVWAIEVEDFPAFILVDDKGNDFFTTCVI